MSTNFFLHHTQCLQGMVLLHIFFFSACYTDDRLRKRKQYLSLCMSVCLSVCLFLSLSVCLPVCLPVCLSVFFSVCLSDCLSFSQFVCLSFSQSLCLSVCLFLLCILADVQKKLCQFINRGKIISLSTCICQSSTKYLSNGPSSFDNNKK